MMLLMMMVMAMMMTTTVMMMMMMMVMQDDEEDEVDKDDHNYTVTLSFINLTMRTMKLEEHLDDWIGDDSGMEKTEWEKEMVDRQTPARSNYRVRATTSAGTVTTSTTAIPTPTTVTATATSPSTITKTALAMTTTAMTSSTRSRTRSSETSSSEAALPATLLTQSSPRSESKCLGHQPRSESHKSNVLNPKEHSFKLEIINPTTTKPDQFLQDRPQG